MTPVCPVCSLSVKSHDGAARFGDQLMHGACYVKFRTAKALAACRAEEASRDRKGLLARCAETIRIAVIAEVRHVGEVWTPALATVSNAAIRTIVFGFAFGKLDAVRVLASRVHHS